MSFSSLQRGQYFFEMEHEQFEVLIIGGGITGAGIALDASSRGMKVALVEMQDFAAGTSSRSTKLVHGGLRYLEQYEAKLVAEVGKERAIVYENGPHVTTPEWMVLPIYENGSLGKLTLSMGLRVYDFLAGVRYSERRKMLSVEEVINKEPLVKRKGLKGGGYYVEYRTDDARLTIEVLKQAVNYGALAINYAKVEEFLYENGKVVGAKVVDQLTGKEIEIYARKIVNATGPWVDTLREKDQSMDGKRLQITKGIHLVFDQKIFPLRQAIYFNAEDGRMVFAIPRDGRTYVGTTDTIYDGDMVNPQMTASDRDYLIKAINFIFPNLHIKAEHVESSWAGLRPLIHEEGKSSSAISRKDEVWESKSGLITIAGGKLTGYRKMAEMIVELVSNRFKEENYKIFSKSLTETIPISGGEVGGSAKFKTFIKEKTEKGINLGLNQEDAQFFVHRYGSNVDQIFKIIEERIWNDSQTCCLPIVMYAQLKYAIEYEMTVKPVDFFIRRTGTLFFNINWVHKWKGTVIDCMARQLGWSNDEKKQYTSELEKHLHDAVVTVKE